MVIGRTPILGQLTYEFDSPSYFRGYSNGMNNLRLNITSNTSLKSTRISSFHLETVILDLGPISMSKSGLLYTFSESSKQSNFLRYLPLSSAYSVQELEGKLNELHSSLIDIEFKGSLFVKNLQTSIATHIARIDTLENEKPITIA